MNTLTILPTQLKTENYTLKTLPERPPKGRAGENSKLKTKVRYWLVFFMAAIALSGITAVPVEWELGVLLQVNFLPEPLTQWLAEILAAVQHVSREYPFILYGNDWLAFGHIVIALAFIGPCQDPVRNKWIIDWGILACILVIPAAFLAGAYRDIPFFWRLIDCSFGVIGILPLLHVRRLINKLEKAEGRKPVTTEN